VAAPLRALGHEVVQVPLYLPQEWATPVETSPVFFGAVGLYLRHRASLFSTPPAWMTRFLDSEALLRMAARRAGSTRSVGLEGLTLALLEGEAGTERREVERLATWLRDVCRPDVVHLSNALLIGLARRIREVVGVPVVCSLQDEDTWLEPMREPYRSRAWGLLRERARDVSLFLPVSRWYGSFMGERMGVPPGSMRVVGAAVDGSLYRPSSLPMDPPAVGYLSRMSEGQGLGRLVDAYLALRKSGWPSLRLRVMGGSTADDRGFLRVLHTRIADAGASEDVAIVHGFGLEERVLFLSSLTVLCVPFERGEALGTFLLESMAAGVPVFQPSVGGYRELVEETGGGVLYDPGSPGALESGLSDLLSSPERLREASRRGRDAVRARYDPVSIGSALADAYRSSRHEV
jgi:glycosyltransferase involved in cell wall biosynthesis